MAVHLSPHARFDHSTGLTFSTISWCGWRKLGSSLAPRPLFYAHRGAAATNFRVIASGAFLQPDRVDYRLERFTSSAPAFTTIASETRTSGAWDEWVFVGCTVQGNGESFLYVATPSDDDVSATSGIFDNDLFADESLVIGADFFSSHHINGAVSHDRVWLDKLLTPSEMQDEFDSPVPVTSGLFADWRHYTLDGTDSSGNGEHTSIVQPQNATVLDDDDSPWPDFPSGSLIIPGGGEFSFEGEVAPTPDAIGVDWAVYGLGMKYIRKRLRN